MIQSRSLPGYQVSSSLTGGGAQRKLRAFDSPVALWLQRVRGQMRELASDRTVRGAF
jgi:hypothetical protein